MEDKPINRKKINLILEEIEKTDRDIKFYMELLERKTLSKELLEKELTMETEGMTKDQKEDLL